MADQSKDYWADMSAEDLAKGYLVPHALRAEDEGRYVAAFALFEAARRLMGRDTWPTTDERKIDAPTQTL